jgi:hypothetical protein
MDEILIQALLSHSKTQNPETRDGGEPPPRVITILVVLTIILKIGRAHV